MLDFIFFLVFGFLSSSIGNILAMIPTGILALVIGIPTPAIDFYTRLKFYLVIILSIINQLLVFLCWAVGSTTGLFIAKKYAGDNTIVYIIYTIIIFFLNVRVLNIYIQETRKKEAPPPTSRVEHFLYIFFDISNQFIFYAILISLILFSIKPDWASPVFTVIYDLVSGILPSG